MMLKETFRLLDIPVTDEQVGLHLILANMHIVPPTSQRVRALARWMDELKAMNRRMGLFAPVPFERDLQERWSQLSLSAR